jgi:hypothetical protein
VWIKPKRLEEYALSVNPVKLPLNLNNIKKIIKKAKKKKNNIYKKKH